LVSVAELFISNKFRKPEGETNETNQRRDRKGRGYYRRKER